MGKALGAVARFLLILFIIGLVGYNTYEISRLRAEVAELRGKKTGESGTARAHGSGTLEQLAEAQSHAERASALLKEKKLSEATKEMQAASDAAARASGNAQAGTRNAVADVQKSLAKVSRETADLWKQAENIADKAKNIGGTEKEPPLVDEKKDEKHSGAKK